MKKLLFVLMACILSIGLIGGAFAYFTDVETSTGNTFTAGTLDMQIADVDEGFFDSPVHGSWNSPVGWAPGETYTTGIIRLQNVGSIDIPFLFTTYYNYSFTGTHDLGTVIEVVEDWEFIPGPVGGWINNIGGLQKLEEAVGDYHAPLTLRELVDASWTGDTTWIDYTTGNGYDTIPAGTPAICVGGTYQSYLVLKFQETAGNEYQGASCSFDIDFEGVQDNVSQKH
jgi:predicted ribosomally synthesized peptide with SipW-like signal peptide